jgi:hypothetical protein
VGEYLPSNHEAKEKKENGEVDIFCNIAKTEKLTESKGRSSICVKLLIKILY